MGVSSRTVLSCHYLVSESVTYQCELGLEKRSRLLKEINILISIKVRLRIRTDIQQDYIPNSRKNKNRVFSAYNTSISAQKNNLGDATGGRGKIRLTTGLDFPVAPILPHGHQPTERHQPHDTLLKPTGEIGVGFAPLSLFI